MSAYNILVQKLFSKDLSTSDWSLIFDEWDREGKINWTAQLEGHGTHLLGHWASTNISAWAVEKITESHGKDIWNDPDTDGKSSLQKMLTIMPNRTSNDHYKSALAKMMEVADLQPVYEFVERTENKSGLAGFDDEFWSGPIKLAAYFSHYRQHQALSAVVQRDPQLAAIVHKGWNVAALMSQTEDGWNSYIRAGGSVFDPVHINPHDGTQLNTPMPLWLWLMQKKTYYSGLKNMLESLMTRLVEDRPPQDNEIVLSNEHWQQLVANKNEISFQTSMIEFEKSIESDWKAAIKSNKQWRKWRSNDGGNIIHWLAATRINEFVRQTYKVQKNHQLMSEQDHMGNDIFSYFALGALVGEWGSYRRRDKLISNSWDDASRTVRSLSNANPEKGLLAQWIMAEPKSFFGMIGKLKDYQMGNMGKDRHFWNDVRFEPNRIWNGITDDVVVKLFQSQQVVGRIQGFAAAAFLDRCQTGNPFDQLSNNAKMAVIIAISTSDNLYRMPSQFKDMLTNEFDQLSQEDINLPLSFFQGALTWITSQKNNWRTEEHINRLESWLSQQMLTKQVEQSMETEQHAPAPQRRKRM